MNSLEFIEKIIKNLKEILKGIDKRIQDDKNYPILLAHDIEEKENFEKKLAHFYQIKAELEEKNKLKKVINFLKPHTHLALGLCEIKLADSEVSELHPKYHNNKLVYEPNYDEFRNLFLEVTNNE